VGATNRLMRGPAALRRFPLRPWTSGVLANRRGVGEQWRGKRGLLETHKLPQGAHAPSWPHLQTDPSDAEIGAVAAAMLRASCARCIRCALSRSIMACQVKGMPSRVTVPPKGRLVLYSARWD